MKSIKVEDNVWERLTKLKLKYKFKSLSNLIDIISKIIKKFDPEMKEELE